MVVTAPMGVLLLYVPAMFGLIYKFIFANHLSPEDYIIELSYTLILVSFVCIIIWLASVFTTPTGNLDTKEILFDTSTNSSEKLALLQNNSKLSFNLDFCGNARNETIVAVTVNATKLSISSAEYFKCFPEFLMW